MGSKIVQDIIEDNVSRARFEKRGRPHCGIANRLRTLDVGQCEFFKRCQRNTVWQALRRIKKEIGQEYTIQNGRLEFVVWRVN